MGGKSSTSSSTVQIPPEVLARYNAVNARAEEAAKNPFQPYGGEFVAGLTPEQQAGIQQASNVSQAAQPYFNTATGLTMAGAQDVGALTPGQIGYYQNPYTEAVAAPTLQALQRQQGQQLAEQQARAIKSGAGFGDRAALERANLQREQLLGTTQALAPIYQQGFGQAAQIAAGQQGVVASDMARRLQAAQQLAGLGTGAQQAGIQGAQALLAAGTVGQQTQQADLTARYQEFLQKQGYPFQTAQFLANIAMGTGALSGSTTSTTQPAPFFSDERLKHDAKKIGETNDGLPIYSFKYNGDDRTQIGLMAQDVEKKKPDAVGLAPASDGRMYKTVDYDKATRAKKYAGGGLVGMDYDPSSMGGAVGPMSMGEAFARGGYATGGPSILSSADHKALMAANVDPEAGPYAEHGIYKTPRNVIPGLGAAQIKMGKAPPAPSLVTATPAGGNTASQIGLGAQALSGLQMVNTGRDAFNTGKTALLGSAPTKDDPEGARGLIGGQGKFSGTNIFQSLMGSDKQEAATGGLIVPRSGYALDGSVDDDKQEDQGEDSGVVIPGMKGGIPLGAGMKAAKLAAAKAPTSGGAQRGPGNDIMDAFKLGSTAMDFFGGLGGLFAANGGAIDRKGYAGDDGESGAVTDPGLILSPAARQSIIAEADGGGDTAALAPAKDVAPPPAAPVQREGRAPAPDYRGMVEGAFKQRGLDVGDAVRLSHGESGLRPIVGDDGSSAGIWQLHVGGVSQKYPNPGLGDEYFAKRRPDLAEKLSPQDKIKFLNAPENQEELSHFVADYISKNGASPWTVARNQGLFGLSGGGERQAGLGIGRSGKGKYSGREASQASLGDVVGEFLPKSVPTSANFWVPALSGIGSMLSSKSPYLLGAVGEGLVGGVSGYQSQKKQEQETVKNIFDMVKNRFTRTLDKDGNPVFIDSFNGSAIRPDQVATTVRGIMISAGIDPEPYGLGRTQVAEAAQSGAVTRQAAGAGAASGATASPKTEQAAQASSPQITSTSTTPAPNADKPTQNIYEMNPGQLREMVISGKIPGGPPDALARQNEITALEKRATQLANDIDPKNVAEGIKMREIAVAKQRLLDDKINQVLEYQKTQNAEFAKGRVERVNEYKKAIDARAPTYDAAVSNLQRLAKLASEQPTGRGSQLAADAVSALKRIGMESFIPENWSKIPGGYDEIMKISTAQMLNQLMQDKIIRAPQAGLKYEQATVPSPSSDPDAFYALVGNKLGEVLHSRAKDMAFDGAPLGSLEPSTHELKWAHQKGNELETHKREAFGQIPVNPAVSEQQVKSLQESYKDKDTGSTFTPRRPKTQEEPAKQAAPAAPVQIKNEQEYNALKKDTPYMAPDGTIRRKQ